MVTRIRPAHMYFDFWQGHTFLSSPKRSSGAQPASYTITTVDCFPGSKRTRSDGHHSLTSSAEVKVCSYIYVPVSCLHGRDRVSDIATFLV